MRMSTLALALSTLTIAPAVVSAHELWLEPLAYQVEPGGQLQAQIKNGQEFGGTPLPYIDRRFRHFIAFVDGKGIKVIGRNGDIPAMDMTASREGLNVLAYQSTPSTISYANWEKFQTFVDHKDFGDVRPEHDARGLPEADFTETYVRYSKSLVGVGASEGSDQRVGFETELVALTNPYSDALTAGFKVQLFYGSDARDDEQVEVFAKAPDDTVIITYVRTDAEGIATIPVESGVEYQLDAVVLRPATGLAAESGSVYETLWANMTFSAP
jgi:uncharacterized GH25 family protein